MRALLTLLLCVFAIPALAEADRQVVVAMRALPAGTVLTYEMVGQRKSFPPELPPESFVREDSAAYVIGQRIIEPLDVGEALQWGHFSSIYINPTAYQPYCDRIQAAQRMRRAYPSAPVKPAETQTVLVTSEALLGGTVLKRKMLTSITVPSTFASRYWVSEDAIDAVVGTRLLETLDKGDVLRYPRLAPYASEPRCDWLFEDAGNRYATKGPAEAAGLVCPKGTRRVDGVPGGAQWRSLMPGWVAYCEKPDGRRHGPLRAWHRMKPELEQEGAYADGQRTGVWKSWMAGVATIELTYVDGKPHGPLLAREPDGTTDAQGDFMNGRREGLWKIRVRERDEQLHATFSQGLPHGTWKWIKADGSVSRQLDFEKGIAQGAFPDAVVIAAAARDVPPGTLLTHDMLTPHKVPASFLPSVFLSRSDVSHVTNQRMEPGLSKGAPLMWSDGIQLPELSVPPPKPVSDTKAP
ncbi:SAF domain-containing protein [Corallococcus terminator]